MKGILRLIALHLLLFATVALFAGNPWRSVRLEGEPEAIDDIELVADGAEPLVRDWLVPVFQEYLERILGVKPPVVEAPSGRFTIVLGAGELARANGLDVEALPPEGYYIRRSGRLLFLCGKDDPAQIPQKNFWKMRFPRGSVSAAYDFLERFGGCVFAFPNPQAEALPPSAALKLPPVLDIVEAPDFTMRDIEVNEYGYPCKGAMDVLDSRGVQPLKRQALSLRLDQANIPFGHGLVFHDLVERFAKSNPEFFALMPDGGRYNRPNLQHTGHICYSSKELREIIYQDVKAYLQGEPPQSRGLERWAVNGFSRNYVNVMPQDWLYFCCCPKCSGIARGERFYQDGGPEPERAAAADAISEMLWDFTAEIAERLESEGIPGIVTQMAYSPSREPPRRPLPDNIEVMVALPGQAHHGDWENEVALLKRWKEKLGRKVYIWTYPGKAMSKAAMVGIPAAMHRHNGKYFQMVKEYIRGAMLESESDFYLFNHLNDYVFAHVAWNNDIDTDALLGKYFRTMYGKGAPMMEEYFNTLEDLWCGEILTNVKQTGLGPVPVIPPINYVWDKIYSAERMSFLEALLEEAEEAVLDDPGCLERVRFMRREFHGPIAAARAAHLERVQGFAKWSAALGEAIFLRPCKGAKVEAPTRVILTEDDENLILDVECMEPDMETMRAKVPATERDTNCWEDSDFEFFIATTDSRKEFYQIVFNANGSILDSRENDGDAELSWDSLMRLEVRRGDDRWSARGVIPKSAFVGVDFSKPMAVNFCRHRVTGDITEDYQWSPSEGSTFKESSRWGTITRSVPENLLKNGDFAEGVVNGHPVGWSTWSEQVSPDHRPAALGGVPPSLAGSEQGGTPREAVGLDHEVFMTAGASLRLRNIPDVRCNAIQEFRAKANARYTLSYYVRIQGLSLEDVSDPIGAGVGAYIYASGREYSLPRERITADTEWIRQEFTFTTGDVNADEEGMVRCFLGLWNWRCPGTVWFDQVKITENLAE